MEEVEGEKEEEDGVDPTLLGDLHHNVRINQPDIFKNGHYTAHRAVVRSVSSTLFYTLLYSALLCFTLLYSA